MTPATARTAVRAVPILLVLASAVLFGTTGTARALGPAGADPIVIGAARIAVGGIALAVLAAATGAWTSARRPTGRRAAWTIVAGAAGVAAYQPLFFAGTAANGVAAGTLIALGTGPIATGAIGWALGSRFPGRRWVLSTAIAVLGLGALAGPGLGSIDPVGVLASVGAGIAYAVYTLATKRLLDDGWTPLGSVGAVFGAAGVVGVMMLLVHGTGDWFGRPGALVTVLWLGLGATTLAYVLFARGLAALPAPTVATVTLAEPVTATVLGVVVLGEHLTATGWLGVALIGAAVVVLSVRRRQRLPALPL